jgi:alternate signal-mediated exported protein
MKKIWEKQRFAKKKTIIALVLVLGILGVGSTTALLKAQTGKVVNTFTVGDVNTHIEEKIDTEEVQANTAILKQPYIVNDGTSPAFVRARITISPSDAGVTLYAGTWQDDAGNELSLYEQDDQFASKKFAMDEASVVYQDAQFKNNENWVYNEDDGWYYYTVVTSPEEGENHCTATLFDAVQLTENADITVYQEAIFSGAYEPGDVVDAAVIQAYFAQAD